MRHRKTNIEMNMSSIFGQNMCPMNSSPIPAQNMCPVDTILPSVMSLPKPSWWEKA